MKRHFFLLATVALVGSVFAKEPAPTKMARSSVPGPYPSIIKIAPSETPKPGAAGRIIQSELGGREMQFFQAAHRAGRDQLALAEVAKGRTSSEQIQAVAETLASTQVVENKEIARLAAEKHVELAAGAEKAVTDELAALSGVKFEKAWIETLIAISELGATAYEVGAKSEDAAIRSFAEKMLPIAQARLQMANRLGGRAVAAKPVPAASDDGRPQPIPPPIVPEKPGSARKK